MFIRNIITVLAVLLTSIILPANSFSRGSSQPLAAYFADSLWHFVDTGGRLMFEPVKLVDAAGYSEGFFRCLKKTDESLR